MWPQNFRPSLIFNSELQNSKRCNHPAHAEHLWRHGGSTPTQGEAGSISLLFMNIWERSTVSRKADTTTSNLGRQTAPVPRNIKNCSEKQARLLPLWMLPGVCLCHSFPSHSSTDRFIAASQIPLQLHNRDKLVASQSGGFSDKPKSNVF